MSSNGNTTLMSQAAVENTKKNHADCLGNNNTTTAITGNENDKETEIHCGITPQDAQTSDVEKLASSEAKTESCKENKGPDQSKPLLVQSHETKDYQKEFGEWKGSSNSNCPKWAGPPYLHNPSAPDNDAGASSGPRPGMGIWGSQ
ncbi:hypothetical protein VSDG_07472 [Cytospora chrysosperma]|uniref:Uncharacterized protein n=1 Tax=Cytospora chrysosperma TaxID=252740 RepID=A0A423VHX0_CYTCH|nr:hypothetical protein VSDG_07472 [Valsa sordida]